MNLTRFILVLVVLGTVASDSYSQLLPRRRQATWKAIEPEVQRRAEDFAARAIADALSKAFAEIDNEVGFYIDLQNSLHVFAESQIDPELFKRDLSASGGDSNQVIHRQVSKELLEKGPARIFLAETGRFAEKMKSDGVSPPVLRKMYLEYEAADLTEAKARPSKGSQATSREIVSTYSPETANVSKDKSNRRSVMCFEISKPKDPKNKYPFTVHCSFVFTVQKGGKESEKTLSFDLNLEEMKPREGATITRSWKAANVQYK